LVTVSVRWWKWRIVWRWASQLVKSAMCVIPRLSDTVRRSVLVDSKADMLMFGNGERPLVEVAHRLAMGEPISEIRDVRNTAII
ncbi:hypothetical protein, partial [Morganella morganii]|uniref:hypothetical protein n=1 Tax=Morganella morganii TaxID=582 RepID=UPI001F0A6817